MYAEVFGPSNGGPREGAAEYVILEKKVGFSYRSVLGELMYAYMTCYPDIGYAVTILSKFSTCPTRLRYTYLRGVITYLSCTEKWGKSFHCTCLQTTFHDDLAAGNFTDMYLLLYQLTFLIFLLSIQANLLLTQMLLTGMIPENAVLLLALLFVLPVVLLYIDLKHRKLLLSVQSKQIFCRSFYSKRCYLPLLSIHQS